MRIAFFPISILVLTLTSSALAQNLSSPNAPFVPSTVTPDAQIVISIETPDGRDLLVPLALIASKQERNPDSTESQSLANSSRRSWTFVPYLDGSNQVLFSTKAVQYWTTSRP